MPPRVVRRSSSFRISTRSPIGSMVSSDIFLRASVTVTIKNAPATVACTPRTTRPAEKARLRLRIPPRLGNVPAVVDLILRKVAVETTKANGDSWDPWGGKPDLRVTIRCGTRRYRSPVKLDTFVHDFKAKAMRVRPGDIVEIAVDDQDAVID